MFTEFKANHGGKYASEEEGQKRFHVLADNMDRAATQCPA